MKLSKRPATYELPSYSLTGDLLGFLRCGLQYRYTRIGKLPSTQPVQAWFGQFIHGVLEEAYRRYDLARQSGQNQLPPWPETTLDEICDLIQRRLAAQQLFPWGVDLETLGKQRAKAAINELGPELFPLIAKAEVRLTGARALPIALIPEEHRFREADRYEMMGVIDVVTNVELYNPVLWGNRIVREILEALHEEGIRPNSEFEVILDYKGMRRPPQTHSSSGANFWEIYEWQTQTYAHLRQQQSDSLPIVAGMLVYLNELHPTKGDLLRLKQEIADGTTDVVPEPGSEAERILRDFKKSDKTLPQLPFDFRLKRAIRVMLVTEQTIQHSLEQFDRTVARIEVCRSRELQQGQILSTWEQLPEEQTCVACDARTFCPSYHGATKPTLPLP